MKPVIGVSAQTPVSMSEYFGEQRLTSLYDLYVRAITAAGGMPVVLAHGDPADAAELLERFDALVVPGGGDIDPATYGAKPASEHLYGISPEADAFEIALVGAAADRRLPLLGICRGLQVVNVSFGGSLHQHLENHPKDLVGRAFAGHYRTSIRPGSRLEQIVGGNEILVNSLHHQGVDRLGSGISIAATARDAVVEGIEAADPRWDMVAVQWHPECLRHRHAAALFDWLVRAAAGRVTRVGVQLTAPGNGNGRLGDDVIVR
jgi:putative glutamine amidotransferase